MTQADALQQDSLPRLTRFEVSTICAHGLRRAVLVTTGGGTFRCVLLKQHRDQLIPSNFHDQRAGREPDWYVLSPSQGRHEGIVTPEVTMWTRHTAEKRMPVPVAFGIDEHIPLARNGRSNLMGGSCSELGRLPQTQGPS